MHFCDEDEMRAYGIMIDPTDRNSAIRYTETPPLSEVDGLTEGEKCPVPDAPDGNRSQATNSGRPAMQLEKRKMSAFATLENHLGGKIRKVFGLSNVAGVLRYFGTVMVLGLGLAARCLAIAMVSADIILGRIEARLCELSRRSRKRRRRRSR